MTAIIEVIVWTSIFVGSGQSTIGGFEKDSYLGYALWSAFFARITISWMYDFIMIEQIETGRINSLLTRPISFYEFYLGQFMGYKILCALISLIIPVAVCLFIETPTLFYRLPLSLALVFYYLLLTHSIGFCLASLGFFYNRVYSLVFAKNVLLWVVTGELFPLDLVPESIRPFFMALPFSAGSFLPTGYLVGRVNTEQILNGFVSVTVGLILFNLIGFGLWNWGKKVYSGTGA